MPLVDAIDLIMSTGPLERSSPQDWQNAQQLRHTVDDQLLGWFRAGKLVVKWRPADDPLAELRTAPRSFWSGIQRLDEAIWDWRPAPPQTTSWRIAADRFVRRAFFIDKVQLRKLWPSIDLKRRALSRAYVIAYGRDHPAMSADAIYRALKLVGRISRDRVRAWVPKRKHGRRPKLRRLIPRKKSQ